MADQGQTGQDSGFAALFGSAALLVLSCFWMYGSYRTIEEDFSGSAALVIFSLVASVLAVQVAIIAGAFVATRKFLPPALLSALFMVANVFCLNLIMNSDFMTLHPAAIAAILLAGVFVAYTVVKMAVESRVLRWGIVAILGIMTVGQAVAALVSDTGGPDMAGAQTENPSKIVRNVEFVDKPNVYFVGFESMAPQAVLSKYMGYDDSPLIETLHSRDFRVFRNLFAERVPTKLALNSLLALESNYFARARKAGLPLMSGNMPSPLIELFKHNGYETNTLYNTEYFGAEAGQHVDRYLVNAGFSVCTFMEPRESAFAFFGACDLHKRLYGDDNGTIAGGAFAFLMHELGQIVKRPRPQLLVSHQAPPGHTDKTFTGTNAEIAEFRETYRKLSERAAENMDRLVTFVAENDPEAILVVFGDHGAWLSRNIRIEDDKTFFIQDRYGVAGGVYPSKACADSFDAPINPDFVTVPQVARMLIRCLSGGVDAFDPSYEHKLMAGEQRYEDHLYE